MDNSFIKFFLNKQHSLSVGLVISLAANNADLQSNLVKNGVLWSLMMFLFDYDYTLDESGVSTEERSNQQKSANNMARLAILAIVALCGYELKPILDKNDPLNAAIRYQNPVKMPTGPATANSNNPQVKASGAQATGTGTPSAYTSNATNLIQNNAVHAIQLNNNNNNNNNAAGATSNRPSNFTSFVGGVEKISDGEEALESAERHAVEKENFANDRRYEISGASSNQINKQIVDRLLTKHVTDKFTTHSDSEVLKLLTSNTRNPYIIWDNATRAQLLDFLDYQRTKSAKERYDDITAVLEVVSEFSYDAHRDELQIGGIYIRIYNEMPTFPISNPVSFVIDLLDYLKQGYSYLVSSNGSANNNRSVGGILMPTMATNHPQRQKPAVPARRDGDLTDVLSDYNRSKARNQLVASANQSEQASNKYDFATGNGDPVDNIISVLKALISVIKSNPNVELQCIGHFDMLFALVSTNFGAHSKEIKMAALEIVSLVSRNKECVNDIAACEILGKFLITLKDDELKAMQMKVLETLSGLLNVQRMVKEAQAKGAVIYLLDLFCSSRNPQTREFCAELLGKMTSDKLSGPKVCFLFLLFFSMLRI